METKLIILEQGNIIISDEKLKNGDLLAWKNEIHKYHSDAGYGIKTYTEYNEKDGSSLLINYSNLIGKLIVSDNPEHNLPSIDYNGLEDKFGIIDVEKLALEFSKSDKSKTYTTSWQDHDVLIYKEGFKAAQSLNDKKLSLDFLDWIDDEEIPRENGNWIKYFNGRDNHLTTKELYTHWLSLQQPKVFNIEIETDSIPVDRSPTGWDTFPKIINNQIKITKIL